MYAVTVYFEVDPKEADGFLKLVRENARLSREEEPGCHVFDVCWNAASPQIVFLYELYADADAFAAHLKTAHFATFDAATSSMVLTKNVATFDGVTR